MKSDKLFEFCGGGKEVVEIFEKFMYEVDETLRVRVKSVVDVRGR